ncbi:MAG TPA: hypothetical protein VFR24_17370 [Candidatus Angelobacter sp.]|nr:hypothetical protein [Candidatus Angelobacter sp.]
MKKDLSAAAERLDIALMFWDEGNDFWRDSVLAAEVRKWADHELDLIVRK